MPVQRPILISIAGGHLSGKKTVQKALEAQLLSLHPGLPVTLLHLSSFPSSAPSADPESLDSFDLPALTTHLHTLLSATPATPSVLLLEGCYLFRDPRIVSLSNVNVFVDCDGDVRLARRVLRDVPPHDLDVVLQQHVGYSKRSFEAHILPTKNLADIILPSSAIETGVELVARGVLDEIVAGGRIGMGSRKDSTVGLKVLCEADFGTDGYYDTV